MSAKTGEARYGSYNDISPVTDETHDQERLRAIASIPIMHEGELIALLNMASHSADEIPGAARQILETLAMQIGTTISRIRSRKAIQESEEKYRMLVENSADLIWTLNAEGLLGHISPSWERVLGYEPASVVGKKFHLFVHPDDIGTANDYLARVIKTHTQMASMECRVKHADGTWRWHTGSGSGIYDNKGTFLSFVGVSRDITGQKQAEEALRESETRYRHIFESFEDLYYQTDNDGLITILSPSLQRLSGWKPEDLIGKQSSVIYVKPGEREDLLNAIAKCGYVRDYELLLLNKDGSHIPVSVTASRIYSPEGTLAGIAGSLRDITDRKRMDAALIESEAKYRLLTDRMNDIIWTLDLNLRTTYTNPSIKTVLGFTPQERMVQQVTEQVTPASLSIMQGVLARELAFEHQGSADPSRSVTLEMEYYHKNGSTVWLESVISGIRDDQEVLIGFHGVSRDITERKRADVALTRQGEERRILLDNIHTQVWYLNDDHTYGAVNQSHADFIGISIEDLAFKDMNDLHSTQLKDFGQIRQSTRYIIELK
jgi:PAS domain S-box-containing protein